MTQYFMSITESYSQGDVHKRAVNTDLLDKKLKAGIRVQVARMMSMDALIVGCYYTAGSGLPHKHLFQICTDLFPTGKLMRLTMSRLEAGGGTQHDT